MPIIVKDLKSEFFNKYGIIPMIKKTNGSTAHVYPEITAEKLVQLIAIASGAFRVSFAFERGYEDVEENSCHTDFCTHTLFMCIYVLYGLQTRQRLQSSNGIASRKFS